MLKWLIISFNFIISLFIGNFFDGDISVKIVAPQTVTAGDEFQVSINLQKGKLESFSRLIQDLPAGLKATSIVTANADFTFKDNKVRFIWLKMPDNDSITVTYTIKVDQRLKGAFDLTGKFSYIDNNERMTIDGNAVTININPNPNIDPNLIVDIKDFKDQTIPDFSPINKASVACIRQKPVPTGDADNSYIVNLLVYKDNAQKFAKIEDAVPDGFTAIKMDSKEGIFVFKDGMAKFLWMSLPSGPYYTVKYRLVPNAGTTTAPELKGQFSYVFEEKTIVKDIIEKDMVLANLSSAEIMKLASESTQTQVNVPLTALIPTNTDSTKGAENNLAENTSTKTKAKDTNPSKTAQPATNKSNLAFDLEPEDGVYFRVQIAAGHKPINIKRYFKRFKIGDEIRSEEHNGWKKYSIGSFSAYKQARDYRVHIWNTTTIADAFVAAYNSGQRITVQEALMINSQKWYK